MFPALSTATPEGPLSSALVAAMPSPLYPTCPVARHRANQARAGAHLPNAVVAGVSDVDVPGAVHRNTSRPVEFRAGCRDAIAVVPASTIARHRADEAVLALTFRMR